MQQSDTSEDMGLLKCYPDKRRPLVKLYGIEVDEKPAFKVQWKDRQSGKWKSKRRRSKAKAEAIALEIVAELTSDNQSSNLLTSSDRERLELARQIPLDRLRSMADEYRALQSRTTVAEWVEQFLQILGTRSRKTRNEANSRTNLIVQEFGDQFLDSITTEAVERWYRKELKRVSPRSANNGLDMLKRVLNAAVARGFLPEGPTVAHKVNKVKLPKGNVEILDIATARRFLEELPENPRVATFVLLGMFGGFRPSEMEGVIGERGGLRWEDVKFEEEFIHVRAEVAGKTTGERFVDLHPILSELLLPYRRREGQICLKKASAEASQHYRALRIIEAWIPDVLRHSFCSYLLAMRQDIGYVADQAGNSPSVIKSNYRRPLPRTSGIEYFNLHRPDSEEKIVSIA